MNIGIVHPGAMGSAVGACAREAGHRVAWAAQGRSADSVRRAGEAGLEDVSTLDALVRDADVIISVVPPHAAVDVAEAVAGPGVTFIDANAISPGTAEKIDRLITDAGGRFVDASIIGPPPREQGDTRLYVSSAADVADLFRGSMLDVRVLDGTYTASALKMAYAAWTKGSAALIMAIRRAARAENVEQSLLDEWDDSVPGLRARSDRIESQIHEKAWRFVAEMEHIAQTFGAAGQPTGFHDAAAEVYRAVPRSR